MTEVNPTVLDERLAAERDYWLEKLADPPAPAAFPLDFPRGSGPAGRGRLPLAIDEPLSRRLVEVCGGRETLVLAALLAAAKILLNRYSGAEEVIVGTPIHRQHGDVSALNRVLAVRDRIAPGTTGRDLLLAVKTSLAAAYEHQKFPFQRLLDLLAVERQREQPALFTVLVLLENVNLREHAGEVPTDVILSFRRSGLAVAGELEYETAVLRPETAEILGRHFLALLAGLLTAPDQPVSALRLLSEEDERRLLGALSPPPVDYPGDRAIHRLFEEQARRTPASEALVLGDRCLSYAELEARANRLAAYLVRRGVRPGDRVALCLEHSFELVTAVLAVLKAGGAYVPLDPDYPRTRLAYMIADSGARLVLAQETLADRIEGHPAVLLERHAAAVDGESPQGEAEVPGESDRLAYVIYTSGSTGRPKGVQIRHRSLVNYIWWSREVYLRGESLDFPLFTSLSFDLTVTSLFTPLVTGNRLILYPKREGEYPLLDLVRDDRAGVVKLTPSHLELIKDRDNSRSRIRRLIVGGEALPTATARQVLESFGGRVEIYNEYGPTEATVGCMLHRYDRAADQRGFVPIGGPGGNVRLYVLDEALRPVAENLAGELYIAGDCLAEGYLGKPDLTAERFLADPYAAGCRMYRSGDLVRWLPEGILDFVGRADEQVKIRGFRIELSEVRSALNAHPGVRESVVTIVREPQGPVLVAYYVARKELDEGELRAFLAASLLAEAIPAFFAHLRRFPLTLNGKINLRALPPLSEIRKRSRAGFVPPRTDAERVLAGIWASVLGLEQVSVEDNFFHLGGDSILGIRVVAKANQAGFRLVPRQLFQHQTVADLATAAAVAAVEPAVAAGPAFGPVPLTPVQRAFFEEVEVEPWHYNQAVLLELHGPAARRPDLLRAAVALLAGRHDALRLRYARSTEGWQQAAREPGEEPPAVAWIDLAAVAGGREALAAAAAALQASLDLERGPIARFAAFDLGAGEPVRLLAVVHHLAVDGVSWRILLEELDTALADLAAGVPPRLPPATTSFKTWAERIAEHARSGALDGQLAHWLSLGEAAAPPFPADFPGGRNDVASSREVSIALTEEETRLLLQEVPRAYRTQISDVLLTALVQAFAGWTGSPRLLVTLEGHGREEVVQGLDLSRTLGWFTAVFPVRLELAGAGGPGGALKAIKEGLRAVPERGVGYGLLRYLGVGEGAGRLRRQPTPELSFNYLGRFDDVFAGAAALRPAREGSGPARGPRQRRAHVLEVDGLVAGGRLGLRWTYSAGLHRQETVERLAADFAGRLRALIAHCTTPGIGGWTPSDFPLAGIGQEALDRLSAGRDLEDLYPLSPLQSGLLFHSLDERGAGTYFRQLTCTLRGPLDAGAFLRACQAVVDRHSVLRTAFLWEGVPAPLQMVAGRAALPFAERDWRSLPAPEREARCRELRRADREQGFDLGVAPLMRLALVRLEDEAHQLVWSFHHLISDGWSFPLVIAEAFALYEAFRRGEEPRRETPRPFRDYIAWLVRQDLAAAERFWRGELAGFPAPTPLAPDRERGPQANEPPQEAERSILLPARVTGALQEWSRRHRLTLNTVLQGAWGLLLARYAGTHDVVFGAVSSGRSAALAGIESMLGVFINTLPVRVTVPERTPLLAWLRGLQERQAEAREHEYSPLAQVQAWSEVPRGHALFQTLMAFENFPVEAAVRQQGSSSLRVSDLDFPEATNYPLTLMTAPGPRMPVRLIYDRRRFDDATAVRRLRHFEALLTAFAEQPQMEVRALPLLTAAERHQFLAEWNDTRVERSREGLIHQLFERQADRRPEALAVVAEGERLTYGELEERANRLAHLLTATGAGPGDEVAVYLGRSAAMVIAVLGILKAGATYVPLDADYPRARIEWILGSLGIRHMVTESGRSAALAGLEVPALAHLVVLDEGEAAAGGRQLWSPADLARQPARRPPAPAGPDGTAYVIFTSGSTGTPKGVVLRHRPVVNLIEWVNGTFGVGESDQVLFITSLCFDLSVYDIFGLLAAGGSIRVATRAQVRDPQELLRLLREEPVTFWDSAPAALQQLVPWLAPPAVDGPGSRLRLVFLSGDWIPVTLPDQLREAFPGARVIGLGGATEAAIWSNFYPVDRSVAGRVSVPYGRPIQDARYHVLDERLEPCALGVEGDLFIADGCLASGYAGAPELTAERFIPDPFADGAGARFYRTGDRARYLADGNLEFLGRRDQQVKIRGFRIELGEIEACLAQHPEVADAVALVRDEEGHRRLVAYFVPRREPGPERGELRSFLAERLPDYMIPAAFLAIPRLPLTANGKLDRAALPAPGETTAAAVAVRREPRNEVEQRLVHIWAELLRLDAVGIDDNFFELGGDSILSLQIVSRAAQAGLRIAPNQLFEHPTIAELAEVTGAVRATAEAPESFAGEVPLTPAQRWFFAAEPADPHHFNQSLLLEVRGGHGAAVLRPALATVAAHHDALRLGFRQGAEGWSQSHAEGAAEVPFSTLDLSALGAARWPRALEGAAARLEASLDLGGPLLRAALFHLGGGAPDRLLLVAHHLVVDGVSWRVLLEDLGSACSALAGGRAPVLPPKTASFQRWAGLLAAHARSAAVEAELPYWTAPERRAAARLPADFDLGADTVASARAVTVALDREETQALLAAAPTLLRSQVQELLLTALARALERWTGSPLQLVETERHGREPLEGEEVDLSRTVGWLTTFVPVLLDLRGAGDPLAALRRVKEQMRAVPGRGLGHGLLRHLGAPETVRRLRDMPEPEVSFNYLGRLDQALPEGSPFAPAPESAGPVESPAQRRRYRLMVNAAVLRGELGATIVYSDRRHRRETVEALAAELAATLRSLLAQRKPRALVPSDFPLAGLDAASLDRLAAAMGGGIEDIYPLAPLQEGLLFHALERPSGTDLYFEQLTCRLVGPLDLEIFQRAWRQAAARHSILRTVFVWEGLAAPLQVVREGMEPEWETADWRGLTAAGQEAQLVGHLERDRARGLDLSRGPLLRVGLFRLGPEDHRFVWSFHHLLLDGWSLSRVLAEVFTLYEALREGLEPALPRPRAYRDYVAWVKRRDLAESAEHWRRVLAGFTTATPLGGELVGASRRPGKSDYGEREVELPAGQTAYLESAARRLQVTLNTLVQGAWALLLGRYGGSLDVVFGAVSAGRPAELEGAGEMVGLFINTLPVRAALPPLAAAGSWLQELQAGQAEARRHEHTPLSQVQRWSEVPAGEPLFESLLVFESFPVERGAGRGSALAVRDFRFKEVSNYPLTFLALPGERLRFRAIFDAGRFDAVDIGRRLVHFGELLAALAAGTGRRLAELPMLTAAERQQLLTEWSDTGSAFPAGRCVHELFAEQAARRPETIAVVFGEESLTYGELDRRSNRLARHLRRLGVGPEVRVGLFAERSLELVVGMLGILKAGGAFVPVDLGYPAERIAMILADAGCPVMVTQSRWLDRLPAAAARVVLDDERAFADLPGDPVGSGVGPDGLAYVMFTSGSTGRPKGVAVPHRAIVRLVRDTGYISFSPDEVFLQLAPVSFDASTLEIWGPLLNGGRLVVYPARRPDLDELAEVLARHRVTTLWLTAGLFHLMAEERLDGLDPVRQLLAGGDVLSAPLVARTLRRGAVARLVNGYGPTESTTFACCHVMSSPQEPGRTVPIGRPIANTRAWVLDGEGRPVPVGVTGELFLGGDGLARGYLGDAALTAEKFVPAPSSRVPGERLYRTGDLARFRRDGLLEFLGRIDQQVKIRGFRVESGEIEAALEQHPEVAGAAVMARGETGREATLVAYVMSPAAKAPRVDELRAFLRERLPEPMVPAAFVRLDAFPLTANGKVDRRALSRLETAFRAPARTAPAARTPVEQLLTGLWTEVLGGDGDGVGVDDDFFVLGGHSLLATQLVSRVRQAFGVELPLQSLFEGPTVAEMARAVELARREGRTPPPPLERVERQGGLALSFAQERLWFLYELDPASPAYNVPFAVRLSGELNVAALAASLGEIVRRHEVLRTTFESQDGRARQVVAPASALSVSVTDLSALPAGARELAARDRAAAEGNRPFDLRRGPLLRTSLLRLSEQEWLCLLTLHHIASDGWSTGVLVRELGALYAAALAGEASPLPELPLQYADFAAWQRRWLAGDVLAAELRYWRKELTGAPLVLELAADHPRPAVLPARGGYRPVELPRELTAALGRTARREGATLYMLLLAGFAALLSRYTGERDVLVGSPVAGRNRREIEDLIGFFVNTLVMRADLGGDPTVGELLARVRRSTLSAYSHQDLPFEELVGELQPERNLAQTPVVQVLLVLQNAPLGELRLPGLVLTPVETAVRAAKFDLSLDLEERGGALSGTLSYRAALFEAPGMERLVEHYGNLLSGLAADPGRRLSELPLLGEAERHQLVVGWNGTAKLLAGEALLHELVEAQALRTPEAVAVVFAGEALTYRQLDARSNRLAHRLTGLGVGPDVPVGVCLERSLDLVVSLLAVLKAGGAYLPLDPSYPGERLSGMVSDSAAPLVIAERRLAGWERGAARWLFLEEEGESLAAGPAAAPPGSVEPGNLAYVLYTSGSTGRPKGVMVSHGAIVNQMSWLVAVYPLDAGDVVLQKTPIGFDASVWELWAPLLTGARLVMAEPGRQGDAGYLVRTCRESRVTVLQVVPSLLRVLLSEPGLAECQGLRRLFCGGEALGRDLVVSAQSVLGAELVNLYGPTEATIQAMSWTAERPLSREVVPLGQAVWNTSVYLLDAALTPSPLGVPGEVCIGGAQLARGYLGRPDLTASSFVPDPFEGGAGARLYRTGDLARRLPGGEVEYLGRLDHQVKIRGFRIELGEIESVLAEHAGVREAVVQARDDGPGGRRLVAYVVAAPGGSAGEAELRTHLAARLPDYMVPSAIVRLEALPRMASGKVDRRALPRPEWGPPESRRPGTPEEEVLAAIWCEVLAAPEVGAEDDFFALGGHSLLGAQVISRVRQAFGVELPLRSLFEGPTVAEMARAVELARREGRTPPPPLERVERQGGLALSFAQERLWFLYELDPASPAYNVPFTMRLSGELNVAALAASLGEIVRRHEVLRTTFESQDGRARQVIAPASDVGVAVTDLSALPAGARELAARELAAAEGNRPFDLRRGPLLRTSLLRLSDQEWLCLLTLHHIASDGWSTGVLVRELGALYAAALAGEASPLPELPLQYADFAAWQRRWLAGDVLAAELRYWREELSGAPLVLELAADHPRPAVASTRGGYRLVELPRELTGALGRTARRDGATLYMLLLAGFAALLSRYTGERDVLVGSPVAGRNRRETEDLIGFFVNTLVMRADLEGDPDARQLLARVRRATLAAYTHQDLPFERLVGELQPERNLAQTPVVQAVLVLQNAPAGELSLPGLTLTPVETAAGTAKFDVSLGLEERGGALSGALAYRADLFEAASMERLVEHYRNLLSGLAADPGRRLSELPLLGGAERRQLTEEARPRSSYAAGLCLHELFAIQAELRPDAVAVVCDGESLGYGELRARAGRLARRLQALGVGPEEPVGLCVERSVEMVVGILAILQAGGAYVPLDPAYPESRLRFLFVDSRLRVLLTQSHLRGALPAHHAVVIDLDAEPVESEPPSGAPAPEPGNLAYVIYTSGSTGRPKGVGVTHANAVRLLESTRGLFEFGPGDVWTLFHSHAFDFSVWEIWGALAYGGRLVVVPWWVSRTPAAFRELLARERVTVLNQTPSAFRQLVEADREAGEALALRWVIFGGEALDPRTLQPWVHRHGDERPRLVNMYGITETTVHVTYRRLTSADTEGVGGAASVIGSPLPDLGLYLLDSHQEPVPRGVPGEICVGGAGVARGYLGRPELTADRFRPDPFAVEPGSRLYRSGDLARRLSDGDVGYLGRIDHQVKIRGFRIELGEIEAELASHPAVREAVVLAPPGPGGERRLVAYLTPSASEPPPVDELRRLLQGRLPEYMIPAVFIALDELPLNVNGKLDRAALPAPEVDRSSLGQELVPPVTREEKALARIWERVLGVDRVGLHDNFFALGGDSILSIRVRSLAAAEGLGFELQDLFTHQTIGGLAGVLSAGAGEAEEATAPFGLLAAGELASLSPGLEDAYPLSALQAGMLFHSELEGGWAPYHNVSRFVLRGHLDAAAFVAAVERLLERHPVLRTSFDLARDGRPLQLVHRAVPVPAQVADLRGLAPVLREQAMVERFAAERRHRFQWDAPPLLRFWVHLLDEETFELGMAEHHAILDGWSVASLLAELFALYFGLAGGGTEEPLPAPGAAFRDFLALEQRAVEGAESRAYWSAQLADRTSLRLSRWPGASAAGGGRVRSVSRELAAGTVAGLGELAAAAEVPVKSVLLAAHLRVLAELSGSRDVLTGLVSNGRPETEDGERALGLFLNTVPFRLRKVAGSWRELARQVFQLEREMMAHRRYPMATLQRQFLGGEPLFEVSFNYVHFHVLQSVTGLPLLAHQGVAETNFPLAVSFARGLEGASLNLSLQYDAGELLGAQVESFAELFSRVLESMVEEPGADSASAVLLSAGQRQQLVVEWNDSAAPLASIRCLHELIEEQVGRTPEAVAVSGAQGTLTYRELDARAERWARRLARLGVGPEARVGVCVERSLEMVVALLAVLKAGGAYVPLDPEYPAQRLGWMLEDARSGAESPVVLTQRRLVARLEGLAARPVCLEEGEGMEEAPPRRASGGNLAYVIYTSGSTGRPKGVALEHRSAAALVRWALGVFSARELSGVLAATSINFDLSVFELFVPLSSGGQVILAANALELASLASAAEVTLVNTVPSAMAELVRQGGLPATVRTVNLAGEPLSRALVDGVHAAGAVERVFNLYGPSEDTTYSTFAQVVREDRREPSIGRPVTGTQAYVLDPWQVSSPPGVAGELCLGGAGLARGYLGRPDLTAERFIPDPFGPAGGRLYRTGDLTRFLPDGQLEFLGRIDHQVKVRGFRIELGEIESALLAYPGLRQAAVVASRRAGAEDLRLAAYVAPRGVATTEELRGFLRRGLPEHMIPALFIALDELPLNANGKLDRAALPAPEVAQAARQRVAEPARDEVELTLAHLWEELLEVAPIGVHDDFFALGGHSLLALRLIGGVERRFGRRLPLSAVLENPTVDRMASLLRRGPAERRHSPLVPLETRGARPPLFAVHPVGGNVLCYLPLVRQGGLGGPFYGLQSPAPRLAPRTLEEMAAGYLAAVREVQRSGPYLLAGWSLGGVVAYEMARQLEAAGERPALLVLVDSSLPEANGVPEAAPEAELAQFVHDLWGLAGGDSAASYRFAMPASLDELLAREEVRAVLPPELDASHLHELYELFRANRRALRGYRPGPYGGRLTLVRAEASAATGSANGFHGWRELASAGVEVHTLPGNHYSLLQPAGAAVLAGLLENCVRQALAQSGSHAMIPSMTGEP